MAKLADDPYMSVHAGSPRHPDMETINRSSIVLECTIMVGDIVQISQLANDETDDGTNSG